MQRTPYPSSFLSAVAFSGVMLMVAALFLTCRSFATSQPAFTNDIGLSICMLALLSFVFGWGMAEFNQSTLQSRGGIPTDEGKTS